MKRLFFLIGVISVIGLHFSKSFAQQSTTGKYRPQNVSTGIFKVPKVKTETQTTIDNIPIYLWTHGCGPTALGMLIGYYDNIGFSDLIEGDASTQNINVNNAIANDEHYNDYSLPIDNYPDLFQDKSELGNAHTANCIADFMQTSWSSMENRYGWSWSDKINDAFINYVNYRNSNYTTQALNEYFNDNSWTVYKNEIDNKSPVILLVDTDGDNDTDHFVIGIGYDDTNSTYAVYDTWDRNIHWYEWRPKESGNTWGIYGFNILKIYFNIRLSTNLNDGGLLTGKQNYNYGETANLTATPNEGYIFVDWTENGEQVSTEQNYSFTVKSNRELTANFKKKTYNIQANINETNAGTITGTGNYKYGEVANIVATPNQGYKFIDWTENGEQVSTEQNYSFTVKSNRELTANFKKKTYNIKANINETNAGTITGNINYMYGETANLTATPNEGYRFINWTENGEQVSTEQNYSFTVKNNRELTANFKKKTYNIKANINETNAGTITGTGNYKYGEVANIVATPNQGYKFIDWTENGEQVSTEQNYSFTVKSNRELTANFKKKTYNIKTNINETNAGTITGNINYMYGETANLTATPNEGYIFVDWTENGEQVSTEQNYSFTVKNNRELTANFKKKTYNIKANINETNAGTITGTGNYKYGEVANIVATPNQGYKFINWTENGEQVSTEQNYSFTVIENRELMANFSSVLMGLSKINLYSLCQIFPNPVKDFLQIKNYSNFKIKEIYVYNTFGQKVSIFGYMNKINVTNWETGMYYIIIKFDNNITEVYKFIKQ